MTKIVLLRHGESIWNKENLFTGWTDVDLSEQGKAEAKRAGELLKAEGFTFDVAFTSVLKRAIRTLWIALDEIDLMWIPVDHSWRLNERHYGALQGLNKAQTAAKYGEEQVLVWRRSYDIPPPPLEESDPRYPGHRPALQGAEQGRAAADRVPQGHRRPVPPLLARDDRAHDQDRQEGDHRRPRQQPPGAGQVSRQHLGPGDRRPEHPHRRPPGLRAGRRSSSRSGTTTSATPKKSPAPRRRSPTRARRSDTTDSPAGKSEMGQIGRGQRHRLA